MNEWLVKSVGSFILAAVLYAASAFSNIATEIATGESQQLITNGGQLTVVGILSFAVVTLWKGVQDLQKEVRISLQNQIENQHGELLKSHESREAYTEALNNLIAEIRASRTNK
jgi:hypothetical protein